MMAFKIDFDIKYFRWHFTKHKTKKLLQSMLNLVSGFKFAKRLIMTVCICRVLFPHQQSSVWRQLYIKLNQHLVTYENKLCILQPAWENLCERELLYYK